MFGAKETLLPLLTSKTYYVGMRLDTTINTTLFTKVYLKDVNI